MAKIPNARNYRARINNPERRSPPRRTQGSARRTQNPVRVPGRFSRKGRVATLLAAIAVLFVIAGPKAAVIGGAVLAVFLFLP